MRFPSASVGPVGFGGGAGGGGGTTFDGGGGGGGTLGGFGVMVARRFCRGSSLEK